MGSHGLIHRLGHRPWVRVHDISWIRLGFNYFCHLWVVHQVGSSFNIEAKITYQVPELLFLLLLFNLGWLNFEFVIAIKGVDRVPFLLYFFRLLSWLLTVLLLLIVNVCLGHHLWLLPRQRLYLRICFLLKRLHCSDGVLPLLAQGFFLALLGTCQVLNDRIHIWRLIHRRTLVSHRINHFSVSRTQKIRKVSLNFRLVYHHLKKVFTFDWIRTFKFVDILHVFLETGLLKTLHRFWHVWPEPLLLRSSGQLSVLVVKPAGRLSEWKGIIEMSHSSSSP